MKLIAIIAVFLLSSSAAGSPAGQQQQHRHRHHAESTPPPTTAELTVASENRTETVAHVKQMLQTSPKDALTVTKRRFINQDWCQSNPLIQRVGHDHCLSTTILNRFCYGQCNSFYIPKNQLGAGANPRKAFESCAVCRPKKTSWKIVTLKCPGLTPPIRRKRVQIIHQCRCMQPQDAPSSSPSSSS